MNISIRQKLGMVFSVIAAILVVLAVIFVTGGPIMIRRFASSLDAMKAFNLVQDFRSTLIRRHSSINMYLLLGEASSLNNFNDFSKEADALFTSMIKNPNLSRTPGISELNIQYLSLKKMDNYVVSLYQHGEQDRALSAAVQNIFPQYEIFLGQVGKLEENKRNEAQEHFEAFRRFAQRGAVFILFTTMLAIILTLMIFKNLYHAVMKPLEILRRAALEFGGGHWDRRITVPAKDEFDTLAQAFNTMAANIRQLQLQTIHMERMSTVGQLAGGVAHELNNPLTGVLGNAQLLLATTPTDKPEWEQLKKIEQAAQRCKRIVRGLLDFSRPEDSHLQPTSLNDILLSTVELCEADIKASKILVEKHLDPNLPLVKANAPQIEQVLLNLITNAIHAMKEGGTLTLKTECIQDDLSLPDRRMDYPPRTLPGPWARLSVFDTGHGIPQEILSKIFEPFFTTREIGKGTGLGLSIALGIIHKHGGDIRAESEGNGKGAVFHVYLPLMPTDPATNAEKLDTRAGLS